MEESKKEVPFSITPIENNPDPNKKVRVGTGGWVFPEIYRDYAHHLYNYPLKPDVPWVIGFPRSGTTMLQELVWLLKNNVDFEGAKTVIYKRVNFIDSCFMKNFHHDVQDAEKRNVIKSHLVFEVLPPNLLDVCKVVYIARNPKDAGVSLFNFQPMISDFEVFWKIYQSNSIIPYGPPLKHVLQGWAQRNNPNVLFLFYEEAQKDWRGTILKVAEHLGKTLTEEQLEALVAHMDFKAFKKNPAVNLEFLKATGKFENDFIRKGGSGGWREYFSEELNASADAWIKESLEGTDFAFPEN